MHSGVGNPDDWPTVSDDLPSTGISWSDVRRMRKPSNRTGSPMASDIREIVAILLSMKWLTLLSYVGNCYMVISVIKVGSPEA